MTGFEYAAAVGMLYEGLEAEGLRCIGMIRARYDGQRRNPFDEAECGHHYARAMASWAAILAITGFHYSAVTKTFSIGGRLGRYPWSTGRASGEMTVARVAPDRRELRLTLHVHEGTLAIERLRIEGRGVSPLDRPPLVAGEHWEVVM
jgi:hypothetical protein